MVYRLINSTYDVKELLLRLTRLVSQLLDASSVHVYMLDSGKRRITKIAIFKNHINIWIEKQSDIARVSAEEKAVAAGSFIVRSRMIGLPLIADDNIGAIFMKRTPQEKPFTLFDKELLSVIAEQSVTAIKNLQLYEEQQRIILGSIKTIGKLLEKRVQTQSVNDPVFAKIILSVA